MLLKASKTKTSVFYTSFSFIFCMTSRLLNLEKLFKEEKAQSEWSSLYLILVFIIVALILVALIKPMFKRSQQVAQSAPGA